MTILTACRPIGRALRVAAAAGLTLAAAACASPGDFADMQRRAYASPDLNLPAWAKGNVTRISVPQRGTVATVSQGDPVLRSGLSSKLGGIIALNTLTFVQGSVTFTIARDTYFEPAGPEGPRQSYCYRELCLRVVDNTLHYLDGSPANVAASRVLILPPPGRILALGFERALIYLGLDDGMLRFRYRELNDGEETLRRAVSTPAAAGATLEYRGAIVDVVSVDGATLTYRVTQTFRE